MSEEKELPKPFMNDDQEFVDAIDEDYVRYVMQDYPDRIESTIAYLKDSLQKYGNAIKTIDENGNRVDLDKPVLNANTTLAEFAAYYEANEEGRTPDPWGMSVSGYRFQNQKEGHTTKWPFMANGYTLEDTIQERIGIELLEGMEEDDPLHELFGEFNDETGTYEGGVKKETLWKFAEFIIEKTLEEVADFGYTIE